MDAFGSSEVRAVATDITQPEGRAAALAACPRIDALPSATALLALAPALLAAGRAVAADQALPLYIRDKVAQTTAERSRLQRPS